jgi:nucleotide-binding universal stress UspA family protein
VTRVIAALDNSLATRPVLTTALALAALFDAEVEPLHVLTDGDRIARGVVEAEGLELRTPPGPVIERLIEAGEESEVLALVLGARGTPAGRRPLGTTALAVATSLGKPVVVVPPDASASSRLRRVLIPIEGGPFATLAPRPIMRIAQGAELEVVVVHVHDEASIPAFTDQPQHEREAWEQEFLRRYCPWGGGCAFEVRVGRAEEVIPRLAREAGVDLLVLGWAQELAEGRAPVVRAALAHSRAPIMLVPVSPASVEP